MENCIFFLLAFLVFPVSCAITEEPQSLTDSLPSPSLPPSLPPSPSPSVIIQSVQAPSTTCNFTVYHTPSLTVPPSLSTIQTTAQTIIATEISPRSDNKVLRFMITDAHFCRRNQSYRLLTHRTARPPLSSIAHRKYLATPVSNQLPTLPKARDKTRQSVTPSAHEEITGWTQVASITTALAIRKVSDFVKSITEVSNPFISSPTASVHSSPSPSKPSLYSKKHDDNVCIAQHGRSREPNKTSSNSTASPVRCERRTRKKGSPASSIPPISSPQVMDDKEKPFNFASADAGARIMLASDGTIGAKNVLDNNVDKYLLTPCENGGPDHIRWIDIELSEEAILERFQTANLEYYSSSPRKVVVLSANSYPPAQWNLLGMFEFANVKTHQTFPIEKRLVTRYMRVMFAGRHGHEYYCPISIVRAFGKNLIADWKDALEFDSSTDRTLGQRFKSEVPQTDRSRLGNFKKRSNSRNSRQLLTSLNSYIESIVLDNPRGMSSTLTEPGDAEYSPFAHRDYDTDSDENISESSCDDVENENDTVHGDTKPTESDEDNVFRKVTRMIRTLELNQTLTSQYVDRQLNKFAKLIKSIDDKVVQQGKSQSQRMALLESEFLNMRVRFEEIERQNWIRDLFLAASVMIIGILLGGVLALLSSQRLVFADPNHGTPGRLMGDQIGIDDCPSPSSPTEITNPITRESRSLSSTDISQQLFF